MALSNKKVDEINELLFGLPLGEYRRRMEMIKEAVCGIENGASMALLSLSTAIAIKVMTHRVAHWSEEELVELNSDLVEGYLKHLHADKVDITIN